MRKNKILSIILTSVITICLVLLTAFPALASVYYLDYKYAHYLSDHTITKVRGCFQVNTWEATNTDFMWCIEGDYMGVGEAILAYYPPKSTTGWLIGIAVNGILRAEVDIDPTLSYQYLMTVPSKGKVYFRVRQAGQKVLEWSGNAHSSYTEFFTIAFTSNEALRAGTKGSFEAMATHGFLWVYDSKTNQWLKAYDVYFENGSPSWQTKLFTGGGMFIAHNKTNFYWDLCGVTFED